MATQVSLLGDVEAHIPEKLPEEGVYDEKTRKTIAASDPRCEGDRVDDKAIARMAKIRAGLAAAVTAINTATALKIAEMEHDLAKDYARLAKEFKQYYFDNYRPIEKELVKEAMEDKPYDDPKKLDFDKAAMLLSAKMRFVGRLEKAMSCTGRYCTGQRASLMNDALLEQATTEAMICGLAYRNNEEEKATREALRWERRSQVLRLGSNLPTEAVSYANLATGIFGSIGQQAAAAAQSAAWYIGHSLERQDTKYPERRGAMHLGTWLPKVVEQERYEGKKVESIDWGKVEVQEVEYVDTATFDKLLDHYGIENPDRERVKTKTKTKKKTKARG